MVTFYNAADPASVARLFDHPQVVTSFDLFYETPDLAKFTFATAPQGIEFEGAIRREDIRFNSDGNGNLLVSVTPASGKKFEFTVSSFEDGVSIFGWNPGPNPVGLAFVNFDGISELLRPDQDNTPTVIPTQYGTFVFYPLTPVNYRIKDFTVDGVSYDLTKGVPIIGTDGDDNLIGFDVHDFTGQAYNDTLDGGAGNDEIQGRGGDDVLNGGAGNDLLEPGTGRDIIDGGAGIDVVTLYNDKATQDVVLVNGAVEGQTYTLTIGGVAADQIRNVEGMYLTSGSGNDRLGGAVLSLRSWFDGGAGIDTLVLDFSRFKSAVGTIITSQPDQFYTNDDYLGDRLYFQNFEKYIITGTSFDDNFNLDKNNLGERIFGGAGNDGFSDGLSQDFYDGGDGFDSAEFDYRSAVDRVDFLNLRRPGATYATRIGGVVQDRIKDIEYVTLLSGKGDDRLGQAVVGSDDLSSYFSAGLGNDVLVVDGSKSATGLIAVMRFDPAGMTGYLQRDDGTSGPRLNVDAFEGFQLTGSQFNDTLSITGATLDSLLNGGGGDDFLSGGLGQDSIRAGAGDDFVNGDAGSDNLLGAAGRDTLNGGSGDDILNGGGDEDVMSGGAGNDTYYADRPGDQAIEGAGAGRDLVYASGAFTLGANVENLVLTGSRNVSGSGNELANRIIGNDGNNLISGGSGRDFLAGGVGDDVLSGGGESDVLTGNAGSDAFRFDNLQNSANRDVIKDYQAGSDRIEIARAGFTAFSGDLAGALPAEAFVVGIRALTADQHIIYNAAKGTLAYDADGSGAGKAVVLAILAGKPVLEASDFALI